jgi:hypothetical protein
MNRPGVKRKATSMNIDAKFVSVVLSKLPYPIGKDQVIQQAQQHGMSPQVVSALQKLPDKTYNSPQDLENDLKSMGIKMS